MEERLRKSGVDECRGIFGAETARFMKRFLDMLLSYVLHVMAIEEHRWGRLIYIAYYGFSLNIGAADRYITVGKNHQHTAPELSARVFPLPLNKSLSAITLRIISNQVNQGVLKRFVLGQQEEYDFIIVNTYRVIT